MSTSSLIEKIQKLLALAKSSNINEATAAAAAANKLITQHNISQFELEVKGEIVGEKPVEDDGFLYETGRIIPWKTTLACVLAKHNGCAIFNDTTLVNNRKFSRLRLVGRASDIGVVRFLFAWLLNKIQMLSEIEFKGHGKIAVQSYQIGFVDGIGAQLVNSTKEASAGASISALTKLSSRESESIALMRSMHKLKSTGQSSKTKLNGDAYNDGVKDGKNFNLGGKALPSGTKMLGSGS